MSRFRSCLAFFVSLVILISFPLINAQPTYASFIQWSYESRMPNAANFLAATTGTNGKIYVLGGRLTQEYNPATNTWLEKANMPSDRGQLAVAAGTNGKIYAFGGTDYSVTDFYSGEVDEYDPSTDTWQVKSPMFPRRLDQSAVTLPNGKIYILGGSNPHGDGGISAGDLVQAYDPSTDTWEAKAHMPNNPNVPPNTRGWLITRIATGAAVGSDGKIYVAGGEFTPTDLVAYDPSTDTWERKANIPHGHWAFGLVATADGKLYALGSWDDPTVDVYDIASNTWSTDISFDSTRQWSTAAADTNGNLYVMGGNNTPNMSVEKGTIINDDLPLVNSFSGASLNQGSTYSTFGSFTDPDSTSWTATVDYGDGSGTHALALSGNNFSLSHVYNSVGTHTVTVKVTDNQGGVGRGTAAVSINAKPTLSLSDVNINEGNTYSFSSSFTDTDSTSWTATVDYGDGSVTQNLSLSGTSFSLSHVYHDNGTYAVTVRVTDNQGATGIGIATLTVNNVSPNVNAISTSANPIQINNAITATALFTDQGVLDTHNNSGTYWDWGDNSTTTGTVTESDGSGSVLNTHTYTSPGVYTITLYVKDKDGDQTLQKFEYESAYDPQPNSHFGVARTFSSPAGAYNADSALIGQVQFGVSARFSGSSPVGNVTMDFKAANFKFISASVSSLVVASNKATLRGSGAINGTSGYTFLVTGLDGNGGNGKIRFQIKDSGGNVVYDTQQGASDVTDPTTSVTGAVNVQ